MGAPAKGRLYIRKVSQAMAIVQVKDDVAGTMKVRRDIQILLHPQEHMGGIQGQSLEFWIKELGNHPTINKVMEFRKMYMFFCFKRLQI